MKRPLPPLTCVAVALLLAGCATDSPDSPLAFRSDASCAPSGWSAWSTPMNMGAVNSPFNELSPEISSDGLALYFGSNRPNPNLGGNDIWVSTRASTDDPWGAPQHLTILNSAGGDNGVHISRDGHWMYFTSARPEGSQGGNDLWLSYRQDVRDPMAWEAPRNLGATINSATADLAGSIAGPEFYFFRATSGTSLDGDIWLSRMTGDSFGMPDVVTTLSTSAHEAKPSVRFDGREIVFFSNRGDGNFDLWVSTRRGVGQEWSEPREIEGVNSAASDSRPALSPDGTVLLFDSTRPGGTPGAPNTDLYMATRQRGCAG